MKVLIGNAVEFTPMAPGLVPEILDAVDVISAVGQAMRVVDPVGLELLDIQHVVRGQ